MRQWCLCVALLPCWCFVAFELRWLAPCGEWLALGAADSVEPGVGLPQSDCAAAETMSPWLVPAGGVEGATDETYAPWLAHAVVPQSTGVTVVLPASSASGDSDSFASGDSVSLTSGASLASSPEPCVVIVVVAGELSATVVATTAPPPAVAAIAMPAMAAALALVLMMRSTFVRSIRKPSCEGAFPRGRGLGGDRLVGGMRYRRVVRVRRRRVRVGNGRMRER